MGANLYAATKVVCYINMLQVFWVNTIGYDKLFISEGCVFVLRQSHLTVENHLNKKRLSGGWTLLIAEDVTLSYFCVH